MKIIDMIHYQAFIPYLYNSQSITKYYVHLNIEITAANNFCSCYTGLSEVAFLI